MYCSERQLARPFPQLQELKVKERPEDPKLSRAAWPHSLPVEAVLAEEIQLRASQLPAAGAPTLSKDGFGSNQEEILQGAERIYKECHP